MPTSERTLRNWRGHALAELDYMRSWDCAAERTKDLRQANERILALTQELLDQRLLDRQLSKQLLKEPSCRS